jgi:molybdopterin-guanine dinucleotide biosynthesis protein A
MSLLDNALHTLASSGVSDLAYVGGSPRSQVAMQALHLPDLPEIDASAMRGVLTALHYAHESRGDFRRFDGVMMLACDVPLVTPQTIQRIVRALDTGDAAVARGDHDHWSCLALRVGTYPIVCAAYDRGVRALHTMCSELDLIRVPIEERELANANDQATFTRLITEQSGDHE